MNDKMIEEMAKIIDDRLIEANNYLGSMNKGKGYRIAQKLVEYYQPKIPEGSVVIPKKITEETPAEDLIKIVKYNNAIREKARKKTAKETLSMIDKIPTNEVNELNHLRLLKINIAKQFGVEVEK